MSGQRNRGFTLVELLIALALFALMSAVLFGSLRLAGRSTDAGDEKAQASSGMRLASEFLRTQLSAQHPQRMRKILEFPLLFGGSQVIPFVEDARQAEVRFVDNLKRLIACQLQDVPIGLGR